MANVKWNKKQNTNFALSCGNAVVGQFQNEHHGVTVIL